MEAARSRDLSQLGVRYVCRESSAEMNLRISESARCNRALVHKVRRREGEQREESDEERREDHQSLVGGVGCWLGIPCVILPEAYFQGLPTEFYEKLLRSLPCCLRRTWY